MARAPREFLTMERQFCRLCWAAGLRVKVVDLGLGRPSTRAWNAAARRHLDAAHPGWDRRLTKSIDTREG